MSDLTGKQPGVADGAVPAPGTLRITAKQLTVGVVVLALFILLPLAVASPFGHHVMILTFLFACAGLPGT